MKPKTFEAFVASEPKITPLEAGILRNATSGDFRAWPNAYPVLAKYGHMERTGSGYKSIDPESFTRRCNALLEAFAGE